MASSRLVLPWPFSPMSAKPSGGGAKSRRARFRKSRIARRVSTARAGLAGATPAAPGGSRRASATTICLTAAEPRRALLEERLHPLAHVVRGGQEAEVGGFDLEAGVEREVIAAVHGFDAERNRDGSERDDLPQHPLGFGEKVGCGHDLVDQPDAVRFGGVDHLRR